MYVKKKKIEICFLKKDLYFFYYVSLLKKSIFFGIITFLFIYFSLNFWIQEKDIEKMRNDQSNQISNSLLY